MTDWTTPEDVPRTTVERLHRWLLQEGNPEDAATPGERAVADIIRAFWPVPPRTLADEIRGLPDFTMSGENCINDCHERADTLATRVDQMERDLTEVREALTVEGRRAEKIAQERDEALAKVERLIAERDTNTETHTHTETHSDNAVTDPADVKPGEAWLVEVNGEKRAAVKDRDDYEAWNTFTAGGLFFPEDNDAVTLIARLVPAPRVITNAEDLDRICPNSVILSADNDAWQKSTRTILWSSPWWDASHGGPAMWPSERLCDEDHPVTVLWEPEA